MADLPENPNNREEEYLADMAGENGTKPANPWSRKEAYLDAIDGRMDGIEEQIAALATDISLKGSVASQADLPETAAVGDAYITEDTGIMYVYVGESGTEPWVALGGSGGGEGIKTLTEADYNYPTDNPTSVALWLLPAGVYKVANPTTDQVKISATIDNYGASNPQSDLFIVIQGVSRDCSIIGYASTGNGQGRCWTVTKANGYHTAIMNLTLADSTGTSTVQAMSQKATTSMVFADPGTESKIRIGNTATIGDNTVCIGKNITGGGANNVAIGGSIESGVYTSVSIGAGARATTNFQEVAVGTNSTCSGRGGIAVGNSATVSGERAVAIGDSTSASKVCSVAIGGGNGTGNAAAASGDYAVAIGPKAKASVSRSVALGYSSATTRYGEVNIGATNNSGYDYTAYRVLGGVHDPVDDHDAATKGYVDAHSSSIVLYADTSKLVDSGQVEFYKDSSLTTKWTVGEVGDSLHNGASVTLVSKKTSESGDYDVRKNYQMVYCYYPYIIDDEKLNETEMRMVFQLEIVSGHISQFSIQTGASRSGTAWSVSYNQL